jgi:hypothetical protein
VIVKAYVRPRNTDGFGSVLAIKRASTYSAIAAYPLRRPPPARVRSPDPPTPGSRTQTGIKLAPVASTTYGNDDTYPRRIAPRA